MDGSFFSRVVGQTPLGIVVLTKDLSIRYMNQAARTFHGVGPETEIHDLQFDSLVTSPEAVREALDLVCSGSVTSLIVPYEVNADAEPRFMISTVGRMLTDGGNDADELLLIADDVTARKKLEAEIVETEKTALIGQMLVTLQHEINNPLQVICGLVDVATACDDTNSELRDYFIEIRKAAQRIASLLRHLSSLDRVETVQYINHMRMINLDNNRSK